MRMLQVIIKKKKAIKAMMAAFILVFCMEDTVHAATNKSGCESKGTVTAAYDTEGTAANGYCKKNGKVVVTYEMGQPDESCSNTTYQYVGITDKVEVPQIDASETNVSGGGHVCNGHTSNTAEWKHWFGLSGKVLYGMSTKNVGSVTVTEEEYKKCSYAIAGPSSSFGDGLESNGKFHWIVLYKKLPAKIGSNGIDETAPETELSAVPSGKTAVNPANGKTYGTQAVLTATCADQESRPHKTKTFRYKSSSGNITDWVAANSGNKKTASSTHTVNGNGTYYVEAQDQLGNTSISKGISVDFIDLTAPVAMVGKTVNDKVIVNGKEWTATTVTLNVSASDSGAGLSSLPYSFDQVTWTNAGNYVISQNGTYQIKVQDALGNMVTKTIIIDNFDKTAPEAEVHTNYENSITVGEKIWSKEGANVEIQAADKGCGLDSAPYSFDGGANWTGENCHTFFENGTYQVKVRDSLHNVKNKIVSIEGIDKTPPVIQEINMEPNNWKSGNAIVQVLAKDNEDGCGLAEKAYSFDGGKNWTEKNQIVVSKTTELNIQVRDGLGNIVEETFQAKCTPEEENKKGNDDDDEEKKNDEGNGDKGNGDKGEDDNKDSIKKKRRKNGNKITDGDRVKKEGVVDTKNSEDAIKVPEGETATPITKNSVTEKKDGKTRRKNQVKNTVENHKDDNNIKKKTEQEKIEETTYQVTLPILEEEKEPVEIEEYDTNTPKEGSGEKTFLEKLCISALIAILFLGLLGLLLWYLFIFCKYRVILYGREEGRYSRLGTVAVSQKEEQHMVDIPDELLQKISGNHYRLKVNPAYLFEREGEDIYIHVEERMLKKQVEKQIDFFVD